MLSLPRAPRWALASPEGEAALADLENFTDADATVTVVVDEVEVI